MINDILDGIFADKSTGLANMMADVGRVVLNPEKAGEPVPEGEFFTLVPNTPTAAQEPLPPREVNALERP
jgi:hypothetical protein